MGLRAPGRAVRMVIAYLAFGIVFVSAKIVLQQRVTYNTIYMDLTDLQAALPEEQEPSSGTSAATIAT